jgi:hypothetical protein
MLLLPLDIALRRLMLRREDIGAAGAWLAARRAARAAPVPAAPADDAMERLRAARDRARRRASGDDS